MIGSFVQWLNNLLNASPCQEVWPNEDFHPFNSNPMSIETLITYIENIQQHINSDVKISLHVEKKAGSELVNFELHTERQVYRINVVHRVHDGGWMGALLLKEPNNIELGSGALCLETWTIILSSIVGCETVNIQDKSERCCYDL